MLRKSGTVIILAASFAAVAAATASAGSAPARPDGTPRFGTAGGVAHPSADTVPWFRFSYTDPTNGASYPITMVGSDPRGLGSTTVPTEIVPLKLRFVAGNQKVSQLNDYGGAVPGFRATAQNHTFDGTARVDDVIASPVFSNYTYPASLGGDHAVQLGDAFMRAQFGKIGTSYHVTLARPTVLPTVSIDVPANQGLAYYRPAGALAGIADYTWFSSRIQSLMRSLHLDPHTLPIFLTDNVMLYDSNNYLSCCTIGYHGASQASGLASGSAHGNGGQPVQTFIFAAWSSPNTYSGFNNGSDALQGRGLGDIHALSHEVSEWLDDPFVNNLVDPWTTGDAFYGCSAYLEVGDPVVGYWFPLSGNPEPGFGNTWHPEDEIFLNWFARDGEPAGMGSWDGRYNLIGSANPLPFFSGPAAGC